MLEIIQLMFIFKQLSYRALLQVQLRLGKHLWLKGGPARLMEAAASGREGFQISLCTGTAGVLGDKRGLLGGKPSERGVCDLNSHRE